MSHIISALVGKLAYGHEAWVVGSAAQPNINYSEVRDYDVMVPSEHWRAASMLISTSTHQRYLVGGSV